MWAFHFRLETASERDWRAKSDEGFACSAPSELRRAGEGRGGMGVKGQVNRPRCIRQGVP